MTDDEALETLFAMANVQDGYAKKATDPGLKVIHKANAKAQREVAATIKDLRARLASTTAERDAAVSEAQRLREALDYWKHKHSVLQDLATEHGTATAKNTNALTASLAEAEAERADEWRRRRDADASRDAAKAACETMRAERDAALAQVEKLREALAWYGEQSRLARLIHTGGDAGRNAIAADGGKRARAALDEDARHA